MRTSLRFCVLTLVVLACAVLSAGCDDIIVDPNFHTWCGDQLCSWKLESGQIRRAPTWHPKDYGVELLDSTDASHVTAISQISKFSPQCFEFSTVADVAPEAQVTIGVDFNNDGTIDFEQPIAAIGFREQKTQVTAPLDYAGLRFVITKKGAGRAVLAQMDVQSSTSCTAKPVELKGQSLGSSCAFSGSVCLSGICCDGVCAECCVSPTPPRDADGGLLDPVWACPNDGTCQPRVEQPNLATELLGQDGPHRLPRQCDPGRRLHPAGAECLLDDDCASGVCDGEAWVVTNFADTGACPFPPTKNDPYCLLSSVHPGRCR
jgi:hypothetical protein